MIIRRTILACLALISSPLWNFSATTPRVLGQWPPGPQGIIRELSVDGNTVYADTTNGVIVLDVSNPSRMRVIRTIGDESTRAKIAGPYLSLYGPNGLRLLNMENRAAPVEVARVQGNITAIVWAWPFAYVQDLQAAKLAIYDFSDPVHPALVGSLGADAGAPLTVSGNLLAASGPEGPVQFFDITDRANPKLGGSYFAAPENGRTLIDGNHAFVPPKEPNSQIDVLDISDLANIQKIGEWRPSNAVLLRNLELVNGKLVVEGPYEGLEILDLSDLSAPQTVARAPAGVAPALGVFARRGNDLFAADFYTVTQLDFSEPTAPKISRKLSLGADSIGVRVSGPLAFLQNNRDPVTVLDISDPSTPQLIAAELPVATSIWVANGNLFLVETNKLLDIFDMTNPRLPRLRATLDPVRPERFFDGIATVGHWAFLRDIDRVWLADISNLDSPRLWGDIPLPDNGWDVVPYGQGALVFSAGATKSYLTFINPDPLAVSLSVTNNGVTFACAIAGTTAYMLGESNLYIWDVSDPMHATFKGKVATVGNNGIATLSNYGANRLEVINQDGLVEYDVSSPYQPVVTKQLPLLPIPTWYYKPRPITVAGGIGYVAVGDYGLVTLQLGGSAPVRPSLQIFQTGDTQRIRWPIDYAGFILKSASTVDGPWSIEAAQIGSTKLFNEFEEARQQGARFYELRSSLP